MQIINSRIIEAKTHLSFKLHIYCAVIFINMPDLLSMAIPWRIIIIIINNNDANDGDSDCNEICPLP